MSRLTLNDIRQEAAWFRRLIEQCDKQNTRLVIDCFPIMSCKLSSMLLSYHYLTLWPELQIIGVSAQTGKHNELTHYWLEIDDIVVDITGDQYNLIDDRELTRQVLEHRPFEPVHVRHFSTSYLYDIFHTRDKETLVQGYPGIGEDFIEDMELAYSQLLDQQHSELR